MDEKIFGITLTSKIEFNPEDDRDWQDIANEIMRKVTDAIFELGHYEGSSEALPRRQGEY